MGANWYCKGFDQSLFQIQKPTKNLGVGFDKLPNGIKNSYVLNQNDLAKLASISKLPDDKEIELFKQTFEIQEINQGANDEEIREKLHIKAKEHIEIDEIEKAWKYLLIDKLNRHI